MTRETNTRPTLCLALLGALALTLVAAPATDAKKAKSTDTVDINKAVNLPIPDEAPGANGLNGVLRSTIEVGKQFKGKRIRDVNVTVQTIGASGLTPAEDLIAKLAAPNGAHVTLFTSLQGPFNSMTLTFTPNPSIGPLTLDDESPLVLGDSSPHNPTELYMPWAGTAAPDGAATLAVMDGGAARGTWTLTMIDTLDTETSNLGAWRLNVVTGPAYKTK